MQIRLVQAKNVNGPFFAKPPVWIKEAIAFSENLLIIVNPSVKTDRKKRGFHALPFIFGLPIVLA